MKTVLFIMIILAFYHWIYESILMPSVRLSLRYKFFVLRDKLIELKLSRNNNFDDELFLFVEKSINKSIRHLPYLSISLFLEAKHEFSNNEKLLSKLESEIEKVNSCKVAEIKEIFDDMTNYSAVGFVLNSGGWFFILIPSFLIYQLLKYLGVIAFSFRKEIAKLSLTPENEFKSFVSGSEYTFA